MMLSLVIADHDSTVLKSTTLSAITAAVLCGGPVHLLVAGHRCGAVAAAASRIAGVSKVLAVDAELFANGLAEDLTAQVLALAAPYTHILAPATAWGKNLLPRVAAQLDVAQISDITAVLSADTFERPIYAGSVIATVRSSDPVKVISVRSTGFAGAVAGEAAAPIETLAAVTPQARAKFVGRELARSDRPELSAAKVVVSGGRGMGSNEAFKLLEPLADRLHAAMGASRAAVDAGFAPNDWQVGQTGKIVAPSLYIAVGISGAIQHLAGMKDSKVIVAINKDPEAPIFGVADYGIIGDLFTIVPELTSSLGASGDSVVVPT